MKIEKKKSYRYVWLLSIFISLSYGVAWEYLRGNAYRKTIEQLELSKKNNWQVNKQKEITKRNKNKEFQKQLSNAILKLQPKLGLETSDKLSEYIITESKEAKLDPILVTALIYTESRFNALAHNKSGSTGLMQVRYSIWKETSILKNNGVSAKYKLFWPKLNIKCGTRILAKYYEESNHDIIKTLYRYNTGAKDLPKGKTFIDIPYINKIMLTAYKITEIIRTEHYLIKEEEVNPK